MGNVIKQLKKAAGDNPIISVSHKPIKLGNNICVGDIGRSIYNIYNQVLIGAEAAKTKYVATAEDDVLYPEGYFDYRPREGVFSYNLLKWSLFTWVKPPLYSYRARETMTHLIVTRKDLIKTLKERFEKYPNPENIPEHLWGEPGRYNERMGLTPVDKEASQSDYPSVVFSTKEALGFGHLGTRKAHSKIRAYDIPTWGRAEDVLKLYAP